jgi:NADH-quinone oxidoreductase subunit D
MNFGPQHPAAHGVLRLVLEMDGETVQRADPHVGLLHRAPRSWPSQAVQPVDRLHGPPRLRVDDVQRARLRARDREAARHRAAERAQYIRVMFDEITRILNHLMWLGAHGSTSAR